MMWGWVLTQRSWSLWSETGRCKCDGWSSDHGLCYVPCSVGLWTDICQEGAISRKGCALALQVFGIVMWPGQATTMSFSCALYCRYLQGGVASSGEFPTANIPVSALFQVMKEDSWFVSQMRKWCVGITGISLCLSGAVMNTRGKVLRQLCECFTFSSTYVAK